MNDVLWNAGLNAPDLKATALSCREGQTKGSLAVPFVSRPRSAARSYLSPPPPPPAPPRTPPPHTHTQAHIRCFDTKAANGCDATKFCWQ